MPEKRDRTLIFMKSFIAKRIAAISALVIGGCLLSIANDAVFVRGGSISDSPITSLAVNSSMPKEETDETGIVWHLDEDDSGQSEDSYDDDTYYGGYDDYDDQSDSYDSGYEYESSDYEISYSNMDYDSEEAYNWSGDDPETQTEENEAFSVQSDEEEMTVGTSRQYEGESGASSQQHSSGSSQASYDRTSSLSMANAMNLKPTVLIDAPYINQQGSWATGCESVSATMLLSFLGVDLTVDQFIYGFLDVKPVHVGAGEQIYAPNPSMYFAGNPYTENSYGCYAPVIQRAVRKALEADPDIGQSYEVVDLTGASMEEICRNYLDLGFPVVFWATIGMIPSTMGPTWIVPDTGEKFTWMEQEHCLLLVGYDDVNYYFNDPYNNRGLVGYEKVLTEQRHREQYSMAMGVKEAGK